MKSIKLIIILISFLLTTKSELLEKMKKSRKHHLHKKKQDIDKSIKDQIQNILQTPDPNPDDLPDLPVYNECWVKYLRYKDSTNSQKPKSFFKNDAFFKQFQNGTHIKEKYEDKDNKGYLFIRSETFYWAKLLKETLNILTSRSDELSKTVDVLNIDFIKPIPDVSKFNGGIKDFGSFEEGFCFQVFTNVPNEYYKMNINSATPDSGSLEIWIFCTQNLNEKEMLMSNLIRLKIKKQHQLGIYIKTKEEADNEILIKQNLTLGNVGYLQSNINNDKINSLIDGYWIIIQDWTQCTLKCGGGLQYQQLVCVPPKNGGKVCEGNPIRTRPCNIQLCPVIKTLNLLKPKPTDNVLKPIVKAIALSNRPQRYDKCHIKEGDGLMFKISQEAEDLGYNSMEEKIPVRIVMNDKTLTLFRDDSYTTNIMSFILSDTKFQRVKDKRPCFKLYSNNNIAEICQITGDKISFVEEWDYDFNLFKYQCKKIQSEAQLSPSEEKKLEDNYKEKVSEAKVDVIRDRQKIIKKEVEKSEEQLLKKNLVSTETVTLNAVKKEIQLEKMLEKEEKEKEDMETKELLLQIEIEKKKNNCLANVIKQKEIEDQFNLAKQENDIEVKQLKDEASRQIIIKRNDMKEKILSMRRKNERKKNMLKQKLITVRSEIAENLQVVSKSGSKGICKDSKDDVTKINDYCENNFFDNYNNLVDCKDKSSFCYVCCENEFGAIHVGERDDCYNMCDSQITPLDLKDNGRWHWDAEINQIN